MKITDAFVSPIASDYLTDIDNIALSEYCYQEKSKSTGRIKSNTFGWQSDDLSFENQHIKSLTDTILERVGELHKQFGFKVPAYHRLSNMWININQQSAFNKPHVHTDALFSGVYYVQAERDDGDLVFLHPTTAHQYHIDESTVEQWTPFNSSTYLVKPLTGKLIIFPSWLVHYVESNRSDRDRISISFNTYIDTSKKI